MDLLLFFNLNNSSVVSNNMKKRGLLFNIWMSSIFVAVSLIIVTYCMLFKHVPIFIVLSTGMSIVSVLLTISPKGNIQIRLFIKVITAILCVWILNVFLAFIHGADDKMRFATLEMLIYSGMLTFLFCNKKVPTLPLKISLYLIIVYFLFQYFVIGITTYGVNDKESGAVNTMVLLTIAITIQILDYRDNKRIALLPSILIIPISIMSWNRTGFFVSILYFLTVFFFGTGHVRKKKKRFMIYALLLGLTIAAITRYISWFYDSSLFLKMEQGGIDNSARSAIWASYFEFFDLGQLLFGRAIDDHHTLVAGFINAHNSFIMLHAQTGFIAIVLMIVMIKRLRLYFSNNIFIFFLFLVLIIRCSFDMVFFFHPFDFAFYIFIFNKESLRIKQNDVSIKIM